MSVPSKSESSLKAAMSVSQMCRMLHMSRSQFYWHVKKGTFHSPLKLASNGRPYFTSQMAEENLRVRDTSIGVGGEYVIFYERSAEPRAVKKPSPNKGLLEGLKSLGLISLTSEQLSTALNACYPNGTDGEEDSDILRTVFRHLKRAGSG